MPHRTASYWIDHLTCLNDAQLAEVLIRLGTVVDYLPSKYAPLAERRAELARWAASSPANGRLLDAALPSLGVVDPATWLARMREKHSTLTVLGLRVGDAHHPFSLRELYVEVELAHAHVARDIDHRGYAPPRRDPLDEARTLGVALDAVAAAPRAWRGLVLVGLPGSGKTTLLKRQLQDATQPTALLRFSTLDLRQLDGDALGRWAEAEAVVDRCPGAGAALARQTGPITWLLDGFDELPTPDDRRRVADWLAEEVLRWPDATFVVTTRKAAWDAGDHKALRGVLATYTLLHLTWKATQDYVAAWFPANAVRELGPTPTTVARQDAEARAAAQVQALLALLRDPDSDARERLQRFAGNPLLLSLVCLVYHHSGHLPQRRGELYRQCFEVLVRGRRREGRITGFEPRAGKALLGPLAWDMQHSTDDVASPKEAPRASVLQSLRAAREAETALQGRDPEDLLRVVVEECGLLVSPDAEAHAFSHLTFQEYLAFEHGHAQRQAAWLAEQARDPRWREPILLGMAEPNFQATYLEALLALPGQVAATSELLRACQREAALPVALVVAMLQRGAEPEAWWRRLLGWNDPERPTPGDLVEVLRLLRVNPPAAVKEAATGLLMHKDPIVCAAAAALLAAERPVLDLPEVPVKGARLTLEMLGMEMVGVPAGRFVMGATRQVGMVGYDPETDEVESPPHPIQITRPFWLGRFPVTNAQYRRYVEAAGLEEPQSFRTDGFDDPQMPVTCVSWHDAWGYCRWASQTTGLAITLPTEAEWEFAARGPERWRYPWGNEPGPDLSRAWFDDASGQVRAPAPVGGRPAGAGPFGAEEQSGQVWEWCADAFDRYQRDTLRDPGLLEVDNIYHGDDTTVHGGDEKERLLRGGSWFRPARRLRAVYRDWHHPRLRSDDVGFRVVCRLPDP